MFGLCHRSVSAAHHLFPSLSCLNFGTGRDPVSAMLWTGVILGLLLLAVIGMHSRYRLMQLDSHCSSLPFEVDEQE
ncbi:hypothetical protein CKO29_06800 [Allochromatium vinosum]|nr:hypothetical protein [Allochromatium vinosum]